MHPLVHRQLQQQCYRENGAKRIPLSADSDNRPTDQHSLLFGTIFQFMGRPQVCGHPVEVLFQVHRAIGIGKVFCQRQFTHINLASSCVLCTYG